MNCALRATGISKAYGTVHANAGVDVDISRGEIHAILGENSAGKSTLMRILYGMEFPDAGQIELDGKPIVLRSPREAIKLGIGMVHQHFMLVPTLTVLENLILGNQTAGRGVLNLSSARSHIITLASRFHLFVDLDRKVSQLSVGEQQRVEILKVLVRRAKILILDEPTAVLMPQEIADLMVALRNLARQGFSIFIVTHKVAEVMEVSDRVSVMRLGHVIGTWNTVDTNPDELITHMIGHGRDVHLARSNLQPGKAILRLEDVHVPGDRGIDALRGLDLTIQPGEILGVAGVEGNGQQELAEAIIGLRPVETGSIVFDGINLRGVATIDVLRKGVGFIPQDRHHDALVLALSVAENAVLVCHPDKPFDRVGLIVTDAIAALTNRLNAKTKHHCDRGALE
jgi:general nucleoside transport system ATP-binding protein